VPRLDDASRSFFLFRGQEGIFIGFGVWWWVWVALVVCAGAAPERAHL
jgi:hypothetical protein